MKQVGPHLRTTPVSWGHGTQGLVTHRENDAVVREGREGGPGGAQASFTCEAIPCDTAAEDPGQTSVQTHMM